MANWAFKRVHREESLDLTITVCTPTFGDAFSPPIPADMLRTVNWTVQGDVKLYSANMDFIGTYGPGQRMMVSDPTHLGYKKAVLIAASPQVEYYCLGGRGSTYWSGDLITLAPGEVVTLASLTGKTLFVSAGSIAAQKTYLKHALINFASADSLEVTAGPDGAILAIIHPVVPQ